MLEPILKETFGVIIYQEQVMQIAQVMAGYSLGEADLLRRAMGKKIRKEMEQQRERFVSGAVERGIQRGQADTIFELLAKFADYGFNKSHAAAYALLSYHTAYMKAHHPVEFLAASMTHDMSNTDKLSEFRAEAQRLGIKVEAPSVNRSGATFEVSDGTIYYALAALNAVRAPRAAPHAAAGRAVAAGRTATARIRRHRIFPVGPSARRLRHRVETPEGAILGGVFARGQNWRDRGQGRRDRGLAHGTAHQDRQQDGHHRAVRSDRPFRSRAVFRGARAISRGAGARRCGAVAARGRAAGRRRPRPRAARRAAR